MLTFDASPETSFDYNAWLSLLSIEAESRLPFFKKSILQFAVLLALLGASSLPVAAQTDEFGDSAADPVKLFERGQGAHARGDYAKALELYEQAIKVRPEFPEAEFQRGNVLVSLNRLDEAEQGFRRAILLKKNWSLPYSALGAVLMKQERDNDAAAMFRQALTIDPQDNVALRLLSELRVRAGDAQEAIELAKRATRNPDAPASAWLSLAVAEKASGDKEGARKTLDQILANDKNNLAALLERADLLTDDKQYDQAIADLKAASNIKPNDKVVLSRLAFVYQQAGKSDEAAAVAKAAGLNIQQNAGNGKGGVIGTAEEIEAANSDDRAIARKAIEKLIEKNPRSAVLLARLGALYRVEDPARSLELYHRASQLEPTVAEYAVGYAAALVQSRRFPEASAILRQVIHNEPNNYSAHANLATALYEAKQYAPAVAEFEWILNAKPEVVVAHYFIATAHDYLGEYPEALASYQKFLASASPTTNQLEIEKVKLRLPSLQRQIQLGEGAKKKP